MNPELEQIRDNQKNSWNKFSPGWKKWDDLTMNFLKPYGNEIIKYLNLNDSAHVLDIAAGTGEPGLTIAPMLRDGKVIVTDLSEGMLEIAKTKAEQKGIKNLETMVADACELPFEDNSFDALSCRFGFMFFPDIELAAKEMKRVLKPGGKIATTVWGVPEKNFWITCMMQNIKKHIDMPVPPEGSPGMFRCAEPGMMQELFSKVGLEQVVENNVNGVIRCESAENYWNFMTEIAAPFVAALSGEDESTVELIKKGVITDINNKYPAPTNIDTFGYLIGGTK